jgi:hypothetical protein
VATTSTRDRLADQRYLTLILRLVVSARGELVRGELVDVDGDCADRIARWRELTPAVRALVMSHQQDADRE